jgi:hypothetical protein
MSIQLAPEDGFSCMSSVQTAALPLRNLDLSLLDLSFWHALLSDNMDLVRSIGLDKKTVVGLVKR